MIDLYSPRGEMELLILRSILEDAGIPLFVRNDTFGSLYPGRYSEAYNRKTICVPRSARDEARVLVREFLRRTGNPASWPDEGEEESAAAIGSPRPSWPAALARWCRRLPGHRWIPGLRRLAAPTPEEQRRRFRLIRNEESSPPAAGPPSATSPPPPLRLVRSDS